MRLVDQTAELISYTNSPEGLIEECARTSHMSRARVGGCTEGFIAKRIEQGHLSILEHASATFRIVTDRGVSHELVRHRIASYTQESTRFCSYDDGISVIQPTFQSSDAYGPWWAATQEAERSYLLLLDRGVPPELARSVLPTCLATCLHMTANLREWRLILELRLSPAAHPQMRELMGLVAPRLQDIAPRVFA